MDERKGGKKRVRGKGSKGREGGGRNARAAQVAKASGPPAATAGPKKANFLLNFKYEMPAVRVENYSRSRDYAEAYEDGARRGARSARPVKSHRQRQMEKDRFLHANFRFVLAPGASLDVLQDPERGVKWPEIEHIVYSTAAAYRCPICLDEPTAPRMTKCGHVYCWTCLLRYARAVPLTSTTPLDRPSVESLCIGEVEVDEKVKKCPICLQMFALQEVRSVEIVQQKEHLPSKWVELILLRCQRSHALPLPAEEWQCKDTIYESVPEYGTANAVFSRFNSSPAPSCKGSVIKIVLERERGLLRRALNNALDDEKPWIELALVQIDVVIGRLESIRCQHEENLKKEASPEEESATEEISMYNEKKDRRECVQGKQEGTTTEQLAVAVPREREEEEQGREDSLYYYQAIDGRRAFIHPLCQRALMNQYGSIDKLPTRLIARLVEKEELTVTDVTRKRFKFLSHLPLASDFLLYEVDVSPFVEASAILPLQEKMLQRQRARERIVQEKKQAARKQRQKEKKIQQKLQKAKTDLAPQSYPPIEAGGRPMAAVNGNEPLIEGGMSATYLELLAYEESLMMEGIHKSAAGKDEIQEEVCGAYSGANAAPIWVSNSSTQVLAAQIKARQNVPMAASAMSHVTHYGSPPLQGTYSVHAGVDSDDEFGGDDLELLAPDYKNLFMQELRQAPAPDDEPQAVGAEVAHAAAPPPRRAKKGKRTKGVALFGNASHRNYRS